MDRQNEFYKENPNVKMAYEFGKTDFHLGKPCVSPFKDKTTSGYYVSGYVNAQTGLVTSWYNGVHLGVSVVEDLF